MTSGSNGSSPDVLIVGGGVIGAAVLFELAQRGVRARLIDRGRFGSESTGKSAAIVRTNYSNAPVVRMAVRSRDIFRSFAEITNAEPVYHECGWMLAVPESDLARMSELVEMNRREGVEVGEIGVTEVRELVPGFVAEGVAKVYFEPLSGCANPRATTLGYIEAARALGATANEGVNVTSLVMRGDAVVGVDTNEGILEASTIVLAAGPWSAKLAASIEYELPYQVTREEEVYLQAPADARPRAVLSSVVDRVYLRPLFELEASTPGAIIVGRGFPKDYETCDPDAYDEILSRRFVDDVRQRLTTRLPQMLDAASVGGVVGLYAATPDWHPYLGDVPGYEGLVLATGGSGHCFKLAPAIGEMVADSICGDTTDYADIDAFSPARFERGKAFGAAIGGNRA